MTPAEEIEALRSLVRGLLNGDVPEPDKAGARWYGLDETCVPRYKGALLTADEFAALQECS